jgi:hypothetical protein
MRRRAPIINVHSYPSESGAPVIARKRVALSISENSGVRSPLGLTQCRAPRTRFENPRVSNPMLPSAVAAVEVHGDTSGARLV